MTKVNKEQLIQNIKEGNYQKTISTIGNLKKDFEKEKLSIINRVNNVEAKLNNFSKKVEDALKDESFTSINALLSDIKKYNENLDFIDKFNNDFDFITKPIDICISEFKVLLNNERVIRVNNFLYSLQNKYKTNLDIKLLLDSNENLEGFEVFYNEKTLIHSFFLNDVNTIIYYVENEKVDSFIKELVIFLEDKFEANISHEYCNEYLNFTRKEFKLITFNSYAILDKLANKFTKADAVNLRNKTFLVNENVLKFLDKHSLEYQFENNLNLKKSELYSKKSNSIILQCPEDLYELNTNGILKFEGPTASLINFVENIQINFI